MKVHIYNLQKTLYEGEAHSVTLPGVDGEVSVLDHHAPLLTILKKGTVICREKHEEKSFSTEGGSAYTNGKKLIVLAD